MNDPVHGMLFGGTSYFDLGGYVCKGLLPLWLMSVRLLSVRRFIAEAPLFSRHWSGPDANKMQPSQKRGLLHDFEPDVQTLPWAFMVWTGLDFCVVSTDLVLMHDHTFL
jgi:hypothetical protein